MKYNPAFLDQGELIEQFVVRHGDLETVLQTIRENTVAANQHVLVIGPRGSGKTMLVRRAAAEIARDPQLRDRWYPLVFSEESYEVTTPGEFWLEALFHLGQQTKDPRWQEKYDEYGTNWRDEEAMRERALGQLAGFADEQGKRLLLIVENFNALLRQVSGDDAWKLRHTLQNEPRVMLLATATSRFDEIDQASKAMYELFRVYHLRPLDQDACRQLWHSLTGKTLEGDQVRPIQILTGGNARLLTILSGFGAELSLRRFLDDLVGLVDEHTEYFKSHLDALASAERKVYLTLAELWDPSTARTVAGFARMEVSQTSSLLGRLVDHGAVEILDRPGRTKWYQVAERMYNIYYLFRRRGSPADRVRAVVRFMVNFYDPEQLVTAASHIADEVCELEPSQRQDHYQFYSDLVRGVSDHPLREELIETARHSFGGFDDVPAPLAQILGSRPRPGPPVLGGKEAGGRGEAERAVSEAIEHFKGSRFAEAERASRDAVRIDARNARAWAVLGQVLHEKLSRFDEAEQAYRKAIEIKPDYAWAWASLGQLLHEELSRFDEAERAYRKAVEIDPSFAWAWYQLFGLLHEVSRHDEAAKVFRKWLRCPEIRPRIRCIQGLSCEWNSRFDWAEQHYRKAIGIKPDLAAAWAMLARLLWKRASGLGEAEQAWRRALDLDPREPTCLMYPYTPALIECALRRPARALKSAEECMGNEEALKGVVAQSHATELFVELAAQGEGHRALQILLNSPSRGQLEPLAAGLRIFLGEEPNVAVEIREIGIDVAKRITARREALRQAAAEAGQKSEVCRTEGASGAARGSPSPPAPLPEGEGSIVR
jgi:tetratricopeptide (TPR) repeat protein